jgi:hypothetical protein
MKSKIIMLGKDPYCCTSPLLKPNKGHFNYTAFNTHYMGLQMCPFNVSFERLFYLFPRGFGQANRMRRITHRLTYASYLLPAKITLQLLLSCIVLSAFIS